MTNATCPPACAGCRDNFVLPELHQHGQLTVFDGPAIREQIERRRACTLAPDPQKPCLKPAPALDTQAQSAIEKVADSGTSILPTMEQAQRLALAIACDWLRKAIQAAYQQDDWGKDGCGGSINAAELVLLTLERLEADTAHFMRDWWLASSTVTIAVDAFPDKSSYSWRCLEAAAKSLEVLGEAVWFVENAAG